MARVGVERIVKRLDLLPEPFHFSRKRVRLHVVLCAPHRAGIFEAHLARAFVAQFDKALIVLAIGRRNLVPAEPDAFQFFRVAAVRQDLFHLAEAETLSFVAVRTIFAFAVVAFERRGKLCQFIALGWIFRRRQSKRPASEV